MAGQSQSTTTTRSQSTSDTYIPEYSQTPILNEIALHARAMSDVVYNQGLEIYNKNQGNIDGVMRDALSYASPQRIAVDMGMAEAGVQQAGERGRLSAERDLQSYGLDPSAGRYMQLDSANRVMTAAAAAGAGNQQRMADQAAGNAMRQQAIAASLQNAGYMSSVNRDANAFLQTGMQLKYPPLGRRSESTSSTDSQSTSVQTDPPRDSGGGGGKQQGEPKQPGGGGGQPKQPSGDGDREQKPPKEQPTKDAPPTRAAGPGPGPKSIPMPGPEENPPPIPGDPNFNPESTSPYAPKTDEPTMPDTYDWRQDEPAEAPPRNTATDEPTTPDTYDWRQDEPAEAPPPNTSDWRQDEPVSAEPLTDADQDPLESPTGQTMVENYDPYADNVQTAAFQDNPQIDPATGLPIGDEGETASYDEAGSLYGLETATGGWTGDEAITPAGYAQAADQDAMWSDIGQGTMEPPAEGATYDSAYDEYTDPGYELPAEPDYVDPGFDYEDQYADTNWDDYGDQNYEDQYADWGEEDYYSDFEDDYGSDDEYDFSNEEYDYSDYYGDEDYADDVDEDYADEDYADEDYADEDYADEGYANEESYDAYEDYADQDNADESYADSGDYEDSSDEGYYDDDGGEDYSYDEGARGGAVMRGPRRGGKRRARIMPPGMLRRRRRRPPTGYGPRPMPRPRPRPNGHMPAFARGGPIPPQGAGMRLDAPPRPPGAAMRAPQPQQPPRPARGAPMTAPGGPRPTPMGRGPRPMPGNMISANGMPPPTGMPQRMAGGGQAGRRAEPTTGGFVSRSLSPSGGSTTDDVQARLNAGEFVIPKDVSAWKGKEFFYKLIAQARKNRSAPNGGTNEKPKTGFSNGASPPSGGMR